MGFEHILVERSGAFGHRHDEPATAAQCAAPAAHARATTRINLVGLGLLNRPWIRRPVAVLRTDA
jgi:hypothetical protein